MKLNIVEFKDGYAIHGNFPDAEIISKIFSMVGHFPLIQADPPYGNVINAQWDKIDTDDTQFASWMINWTKMCQTLTLPGGALYVFGGIGQPLFRPFFRYLVRVEEETGYNLSSLITWKKRRAYGIQWGYLFCREEIAYLVNGDIKKPRCFNVPLLAEERGYEGYNDNYPAKSKFLRRSNVWADITELFRGKVHDAEKPLRIMEIPIEVHTQRGEWVLDPFAGSGTTALAARKLERRFVVIESDKIEFEKLVERLK